jgi:hypothetical protein
MDPRERLPVFGVAITVRALEADAPKTYYYRLEPERYSGPLRLVELEDADLD